MNKFVIEVRDNDHLKAPIAIYDSIEGANKAVLDVLQDKIADWTVNKFDITINNTICTNVVFIHNTSNWRIAISEIAHNTLNGDPFGICQEYIAEWQRL